jgi:hypothetical protein
LLSWEDDGVSEQRFTKMYPTVPSASGNKITTTFLRSMREYCGFSKSPMVSQWQGFEFSVRDTVDRWGQLDPRRYLIFVRTQSTFSYKEIDVLGTGSKVNLLLDAKSCGGIVDKSQMLLYIKFFEKINIKISKGVFITADDDFDYLGDNIFRLPFEWFKLAKSIDEVDLFIERVFEKRIKSRN